MTHTPGPWHISLTHLGKDWDVGGPDNTNICIVHGADTANARLIAAAPELLEALNLAVIEMQEGSNFEVHALVKARAAIAKVEGR